MLVISVETHAVFENDEGERCFPISISAAVIGVIQ